MTTWYFDLNHLLNNPPNAGGGQSGNDGAVNQTLVDLKDFLKGLATNAWVVKGSSNGAVGALDGVDRWSDSTSLAYNAWVCLTSVAGHEVVLQIPVSSATSMFEYVISPASGFAGGDATNRPVAADEVVVTTRDVDQSWFDKVNTYRIQMFASQNGKNFMVVALHPTAGVTSSLIACWWLEQNKAADTVPVVGVSKGATNATNIVTYTQLGASLKGLHPTDLSSQAYGLLEPLFGGLTIFDSLPDDPVTGNAAEMDVWTACVDVTHYHIRGVLPDVRRTSSLKSTCDTYNLLIPMDRAVFGDYSFPWDGATTPIP